ncbi:MAG: LCCL domain-containing protein [Thermoanaerobaculaceae bacterium]
MDVGVVVVAFPHPRPRPRSACSRSASWARAGRSGRLARELASRAGKPRPVLRSWAAHGRSPCAHVGPSRCCLASASSASSPPPCRRSPRPSRARRASPATAAWPSAPASPVPARPSRSPVASGAPAATTGDSSICAAARHAGMIRASGGKVTVYREGKCPALVGSIRNTIETRDWGAYDLTFAFEHPAPGCTPSEQVTGVPACPASMVGQEGRRTAEPLECSCSQRQITGSVWGSDLYTFDSSVCAAARHAGAISSSGGEVLVFVAGTCASFKGTARNGVTSSDWGPYDRTFAFRYPLPGCADGGGIQRR